MRTWMIGLVVCGTSACTAPDDVGRSSGAIFEGALDTVDESVVMVDVSIGNNQGVCTGSVVSPHVVLTAAHCVHPDIVGANAVFRIFSGADSNTAPKTDPHWFAVGEVHPHPSYSTGYISPDSDVAVVITTDALPLPSLPMKHTPLLPEHVGQAVRIVGYGKTDPAKSSSSGIRHSGASVLEEITDTWVTFQTGKQLVCPGDSGGPMLLVEDGKEVIAGISSTESDLATCTGPAHDARVDVYAAAFVDPFIAAHDPPAQDLAGLADGGTPASGSSGGCEVAGRGSATPNATGLLAVALAWLARLGWVRVRRRGAKSWG